MKKENKITAKAKARAEAITTARQHNAMMNENVRAMELEMQLPKTRKKYIRFLVKNEYKRYVILHTPKVFRWARWIEYFFTARSKRKEIAREMIKFEDKQKIEKQ